MDLCLLVKVRLAVPSKPLSYVSWGGPATLICIQMISCHQQLQQSASSSFIPMPVHSSVHPPFSPSVHTSTGLFLHCLYSFTYTLLTSFFHSSNHSPIQSFMPTTHQSSIHPSTHPFIHLSPSHPLYIVYPFI